MTKRRLTPDERLLWKRLKTTVTPLAEQSDVEDVETPAPATRKGRAKRVPEATNLRGLPPSLKKIIRAPKTPDRRDGVKRVRRGKVDIEAVLDLHGHTQVTADAALRGFVSQHIGKKSNCLLVITGKGRDGQGVLKRNFLRWVTSAEARGLVSGYAPAHRNHGGSGAFYLFTVKAVKR